MLAKMWKKVLLAICIIACIYNIMAKLVNRHSLESNLKTANDGNTVIDVLREDDATNANTSTNELKEQNVVSKTTEVNTSNTVETEESQDEEEKENSNENENEEGGKKVYHVFDINNFKITF